MQSLPATARLLMVATMRHSMAVSARASSVMPALSAWRSVVTPARCMSIFSSSSPNDSIAALLKKQGDPDTVASVLDDGVPQGAPKPSALNRLRMSGRPGRDEFTKERAAGDKMRKALEYKMQREAAKKEQEAKEKAAAASAQPTDPKKQ
jgi:hypothetical protein